MSTLLIILKVLEIFGWLCLLIIQIVDVSKLFKDEI